MGVYNDTYTFTSYIVQVLGTLPTHSQLLDAQVSKLARMGHSATTLSDSHSETGIGVHSAMGGPLVSQLGQTAQPPPSLPLGEGLPALPKKLLECIWAEEYVC